MSESIPKTMKAFIQKSNKPWDLGVEEVPVPTLQDNEVLVKVAYASQNPTDWKHTENISPAGAILGCDISGTVVKLGSKLANADLKIGDKVACTVHGGIFKDQGGYAEYARVESDLLWKVPEGLKMEEATTLACAWVTAPHAMVFDQKQEFPPAQVKGNPWYLVYGASSSLGLFIVCLGKAMGYRILAVCSPKNFDLVRSYGAEECVDYKDHDKCVAEIKKITGGGVHIGVDAISAGDSYKIPAESFASGGGQLNMFMPIVPDEAKSFRKDVKVTSTLMYTLFGHEFNISPRADKPNMVPVPPGSREFHVDLCKRTPELITKYGIKPNPINIRGGLEDVLEGLKYMKAGKVSAEKLVYKVNP